MVMERNRQIGETMRVYLVPGWLIYRERKREEHISGLSDCVDGRVIREGFGMIMTLVLDRLDLRCLWGHPSGDVEQAPYKFGAQRSDLSHSIVNGQSHRSGREDPKQVCSVSGRDSRKQKLVTMGSSKRRSKKHWEVEELEGGGRGGGGNRRA